MIIFNMLIQKVSNIFLTIIIFVFLKLCLIKIGKLNNGSSCIRSRQTSAMYDQDSPDK